MAEKVPMTPDGYSQLSEELKRPRDVELPQVLNDISIARARGDLSENAEYQSARERQGMIAARISYLEQTLARAEVIAPAKLSGNLVQFGAKLRLLRRQAPPSTNETKAAATLRVVCYR